MRTASITRSTTRRRRGPRPAERWVDECGWEPLLNRRGTTYRKLDDAGKADMDRDKALALLMEHPSMIKRPVPSTEMAAASWSLQ